MTNTIPRIGFCCKLSEPHPSKGVVSVADSNMRTTTGAWLRRQTREAAEQRLWELTDHNTQAVINMVQVIKEWPEALRMARIGSDVLPLYTHAEWGYFYRQPEVQRLVDSRLGRAGELAREHGVRLSFHPGQYTVMASDRPEVVESAIQEVEYHTRLAEALGYGSSWHDHGFKINIHLSGRRGLEGFRESFLRLSDSARNLLTVENEEITHGLDTCLELADIVPIVLDLHHHFVHTGEYIQTSDDRVRRVVDSWRGVRPTLHYSVSREDWLKNHPSDQLPDRDQLVASGINRQKLRAHSDYYWNTAVSDWAFTFWDRFDIQCESKSKNLASHQLYEYYRSK